VSPLVRVAVTVTPVPAAAKITPVTVMELVPAAMVPVVVPLIAPAFPFVVYDDVSGSLKRQHRLKEAVMFFFSRCPLCGLAPFRHG